MPSQFGVYRTPVKNQSERTGAAHGLRGRGVRGDCLGALGDGVLCELSGEGEAHSSLDLAGREGALLVVAHELAGLVGDPIKDVRDERVQDRHALGRDSGDMSQVDMPGVHMLEHLVDVDRVGLGALLLALAAALLRGLLQRFRWHTAETHA